MIRIRTAAFAAIAAACLPFAAPLGAQQRETVTTRVETADLDLGHAAGVARLDRRIRGAIARACASTLPGLAGARETARCRAEMTADAAPKMAALQDRSAAVRVAAR